MKRARSPESRATAQTRDRSEKAGLIAGTADPGRTRRGKRTATTAEKKPAKNSAAPAGDQNHRGDSSNGAPAGPLSDATPNPWQGRGIHGLCRMAKAGNPRNFREFWGGVLDVNPELRAYRDWQHLTIKRAEFRRLLKKAFEAGRESHVNRL